MCPSVSCYIVNPSIGDIAIVLYHTFVLISLHLVQVGALVKTCVPMVPMVPMVLTISPAQRYMLGKGAILYWTEVRMVWDDMSGLYNILSEVCTLHMHVNQPCVLCISSARMSAC
jgi:hypothetical protein